MSKSTNNKTVLSKSTNNKTVLSKSTNDKNCFRTNWPKKKSAYTLTNKVSNSCTQKGTAYVQICKRFAFKITNDRIKAIQSKNVLKQLTNGRMNSRWRSTSCAQSRTRISSRGEEHHSMLVDSFINNISHSTVNITFCSVVNRATEWLIKLIIGQ